MPKLVYVRERVDVSDIKTYADFEMRFDGLVEQISGVLTDDHIWTDEQGEVSTNGLTLLDGTRVLSNEDRSQRRTLCVVLNDDGSASVSGPERGKPAAWQGQHTIHAALGMAIASALVGPATNFANKQSAADPEIFGALRSAELNRLLRLLDYEWADG